MRFKNKDKRLKHRKVNARERARESSIKKRGQKESDGWTESSKDWKIEKNE
jgi:hypothetical protein